MVVQARRYPFAALVCRMLVPRRIASAAPALWLLLLPVLGGTGCKKLQDRAARRSTDLPNVLLITIESLRADHVGCYGYRRDTTPNIDGLAAQATLYENAHSVTSWTLTSHASIFTGLYPSVHRVNLPQDRLADDYTTAAEMLSSNGYACAAVVGGPYLREAFNLKQGFEYYDESVAASSPDEAHNDVTNPRMATAMEKFFRQKRDSRRPFFLFGYYWDVHYDYVPPAPYDAMFVPPGAEPIESVQFGPIAKLGRDVSEVQLQYLISQYDGEIRCTDEYLGRLWELLHELGQWDDTAIIVTADHGEEFFEHSYLGHKHDLYVESLHVPLIIKFPRQVQSVRDGRIVNLIDLYPTILELARCRGWRPNHGRSLLAEAGDGTRSTFFELTTTWDITDRQTGERVHESDGWLAVRRGRFKLLHVRDTGFWQLYDVVADPGEHNPLGPAHESTASELKSRLDDWQELMAATADLWRKGPKASLSEQEEKRLRSLGYLP